MRGRWSHQRSGASALVLIRMLKLEIQAFSWNIFFHKKSWNEHPKILFEFHKHMAEILLAISAWQLAMRLKQPMSRAGCYNFCQPSSVSNHWLFVPVPPLTWNCQVAILGMKGTHDENDGTGMAIRLRCLDVLEWVLLMMAWDADKSQDLFGDDATFIFFWWGRGHTIRISRRPIMGISLWILKTIITVYKKCPQGLSMLERSFQHDPARNNARDTFWRVIYKTSESYLASSSLSHCLRIDNKLWRPPTSSDHLSLVFDIFPMN